MGDHALETKLIHAGENRRETAGRPVSTPIYPTVTYTFDSMAEMDRVLAGESGDFVYSRYGNPTVAALESAIAEIEDGRGAVAFGSGMAAIHAALFACDLKPGSIVIASQDLYGASFDLLAKIFGSFGVETRTADFNDLESLERIVCEAKPRAMLAETISNPLLKVCDLSAVASIARSNDAKLVVDNTFASPYLCRPIALGAHFSVHSTTKYLSGHADSTGGIVIAAEELDLPVLDMVKKLVGGVLSVWEAHHVLRGMKTLALRMERHCGNAEALASRLAGNPFVSGVFYPKINDAETTASVLERELGGALVSISLVEDTREMAWKFMDSLKLCVRATSLGDVFTLVSHSASSSHRELGPERRAELGISESLVRISVGIEHVDDIAADIEQALRTAHQ